MKKQIITSLLFLSIMHTVSGMSAEEQNKPVDFETELNMVTGEEYIPTPKPWYTSLATTCAEHTPEAVMFAVVAVYCYYDEFKEWTNSTVKPKIQNFIVWLKNKEKQKGNATI